MQMPKTFETNSRDTFTPDPLTYFRIKQYESSISINDYENIRSREI